MARSYGIYTLSILAVLFASAATFLLLAKLPQTGIIIFYVFREAAGFAEFWILFFSISIPAIPAFKWTMAVLGWKISWTTALIGWLAGISTLTALIGIIAGPLLGQASGLALFLGLALTAGFKLITWLDRSMPVGPRKQFSDTFPEWEEYK